MPGYSTVLRTRDTRTTNVEKLIGYRHVMPQDYNYTSEEGRVLPDRGRSEEESETALMMKEM